MLNVDGATSQRSYQLNLALVKQIVVLASEARVRLLLNLKNNVTSLNARRLVSLSSELNLGAAGYTLVNVNVQDLSVDNGFLAVALLATILLLDNLAFTVTVWANSLEALDHWTHLAHHGLHTMAITANTLLHSTVLATKAVALGADDRSLQGQLGNLSSVNVLQ